MLVRDAIVKLLLADPDAEVMISSDEEGNSFRTAELSIDEVFCDQDGDWVNCHPDDIDSGEYEGWTLTKGVLFW